MNSIQHFTPNQIYCVYSGKHGCMCGCRGTYFYNPRYQEYVEAERGYAANNEEIDLDKVTKVLRLMQAQETVEMLDAWTLSTSIHGLEYVIYLARPSILRKIRQKKSSVVK